jgi:hypothetical protein
MALEELAHVGRDVGRIVEDRASDTNDAHGDARATRSPAARRSHDTRRRKSTLSRRPALITLAPACGRPSIAFAIASTKSS